MRQPVRRVSRRVLFCQTLLNGGECRDAARRLAPVWDAINLLAFRPGERYVGPQDALRLACVIVHQTALPVRLQVGWVTDQDLLRTIKVGHVGRIRLSQGEYVYYPSHMVLFEDGILGFECSRDSPTPGALASYINLQNPNQDEKYSFRPIYQQSVAADLLGSLHSVHMLTIGLPVSRAAALAQAERSLGRAFRAFQSLGETFQAEVTLKPAQRKGEVPNLLPMAEHLAELVGREDLSQLYVVGYTDAHQRKELDLLGDRMASEKKMILQDAAHRAIEPNSAYEAIREAFGECREDLLQSVGYVQ